MFVPYQILPPESKVWIYTANRKLSDAEQKEATDVVHAFVMNWDSHGEPVSGWGGLKYGSVLVLMADTTLHGPSGCSIDSSVAMVRSLETKLGVSFFDRMQCCIADEQEPRVLAANQLSGLLTSGEISVDTPVVNAMVYTKKDFEERFVQSLNSSYWMRLAASDMPA